MSHAVRSDRAVGFSFFTPLVALLLASCGAGECISGPLCENGGGGGGGGGTATPTSISLSAPSLTFDRLAASQQLTATVLDQNNTALQGQTVSWASSNASVATVTSTGTVSAIANGAANITASSGTLTNSIPVTVLQTLETVLIEPQPIFLATAGSTLQLGLRALDPGGQLIQSPSVTWTSDDETIVSVDQFGVITAEGPGTTVINADVSFQGGAVVRGSTDVSVAAPVTLQPSQSCADFLPTDYVSFQSAALATGVKAALGVAPGDPLSCAQAASLTELDVDNVGISDITGIQNLTGLSRFEAGSNEISDLSPIAGLTGLTWLTLFNNRLSDLSPLSGLVNLEFLDVGEPRFPGGRHTYTSVEPLSSLTKLDLLSIQWSQVTDIAPLSFMTSMTWLELEGAPIGSIGAVANMPLQRLYLGYTQVSDLSVLSGRTSLKVLDAAGLGLTEADVTPITGLTQLEEIVLGGNPISDLSLLAGLPNLIRVDVAQTHVTDLSPLQALTGLAYLYIANTPVSDLQPILSGPFLTAGVAIDLGGTEVFCTDVLALEGAGIDVTDEGVVSFPDANLDGAVRSALGVGASEPISCSTAAGLSGEWFAQGLGISLLDGIWDLTGLNSLRLDDNSISDLTPLGPMTQLETVFVQNNQISDVATLGTLPLMGALGLDGNSISDVSSLTGLPLGTLYIARNQLDNADLTQISGISSLATLSISYNPITDISALSSLTSMQSLSIDGLGLTDVSALSSLTSLTGLGASENQISDLSPLAGLQLSELGLDSNLISDISALSGMPLANLFVGDNLLTNEDVAVVAEFTALSGVSLFTNQLTSVAPLSALTELRYISIDNNPITDLSVAANWTNLNWLDGSGLAITNVDALQGLTALGTANLQGTATLTSLTGLLNNNGFGAGDRLYVTDTGVSCTDVATLEARGVTVTSSCQE